MFLPQPDPQSFLWTHFLLHVPLVTLTFLQAKHPFASGPWCRRRSPPLGTLFSKCLNGWLPSPRLLYSDVAFPMWPSLTTLLIIIATSIPTLFSLVAFIATRSTVFAPSIYPAEPGLHKDKHRLCVLFVPLNPGHVRAQQPGVCFSSTSDVPICSPPTVWLGWSLGASTFLLCTCVVVSSGATEAPLLSCALFGLPAP